MATLGLVPHCCVGANGPLLVRRFLPRLVLYEVDWRVNISLLTACCHGCWGTWIVGGTCGAMYAMCGA